MGSVSQGEVDGKTNWNNTKFRHVFSSFFLLIFRIVALIRKSSHIFILRSEGFCGLVVDKNKLKNSN